MQANPQQIQKTNRSLKSPNSQNRHIFAKFLIWQSSWISHTISVRSSIHLVQRADCHFPLEIYTLHWPYVLCQTEMVSPTFSKSISQWWAYRPFFGCFSMCVSVYVDLRVHTHNVSLYWTTDTENLCHHWLFPPAGSAIITSTKCMLHQQTHLVPACFCPSFPFSALLGYFLKQSLSLTESTSCFHNFCFLIYFVLFPLITHTKPVSWAKVSLRHGLGYEDTRKAGE